MTTDFFLFLNIGTSEMMLIIIAILILFGGKKLPELARGLGRGIREFKDASDSIKKDISDQINEFEDDVNSVKTDMKSLTQDINEDSSASAKSESSSSPANMDHQNEISHSDQYYRNYDYNYPEEPTAKEVDAADEPIQNENNPIKDENESPTA